MLDDILQFGSSVSLTQVAVIDEVNRAHSDGDAKQLLISVAEHNHEGVLVLSEK